MRQPPVITLDSHGVPRPLELSRTRTPLEAGGLVGLVVGSVVGIVLAVGTGVPPGLAAAAAVVALLLVVGPTVVRGPLRLTPEGFSVKGYGRRSHHLWREVTSVVFLPHWRQNLVQVGLLFPDGTRRRMTLESFSVPDRQLAPLLLEYRAKALVRSPVPLEGPCSGP